MFIKKFLKKNIIINNDTRKKVISPKTAFSGPLINSAYKSIKAETKETNEVIDNSIVLFEK